MDELAYERLTGNPLQEARDNWKTLCPVHMESTPSFFIHKETYICHCFGCGVKGTLDYILSKALERPMFEIRLALGMPKNAPLLGTREIPKVEQEFSRAWLAGFPRIQDHFFLRSRGIRASTIKAHGARWDRHQSRIVFPLWTIGDPKIVGAVGRTVRTDEHNKWYFYWTTKKSEILYKPTKGNVKIIVEGIIDEMWLYQHGYEGVVALLGAQASKKQVEIIKRETNEVILFLDNDEAGRIGAQQLGAQLKSSVKVSYAKYPDDAKDPQELSEEELDTAIRDRQTFVQYSCY